MYQKNLLFLTFALVCCSRLAFGGDTGLLDFVSKQRREQMQKAKGEGVVSLDYYLAKMSEKLDFHYTLESKYDESLSWYYQFVFVPSDLNANSINEVISTINRKVPEVTAARSKDNTAVIHIVAKRLMQLQNYPMGDPVGLSFTGQLGKLPYSIDQKINADGRLEVEYGAGIGDDFFDYQTKLTFSAKDRTAREILTDYIPLEYYSRLIWEAQTFQRQGRQVTSVRTHGPGRWTKENVALNEQIDLSTEAGRNAAKQADFSEGLKAYAFNEPDEKNITAAIQFIETQMKQPAPLQVRWAMFWLGKNKVEKGIPVLFKYLDYEYTPVPLLDERFPAFRALKEIGAPAAQAALAALPQEFGARRIELICRIVLSVQGETEGRKALQKVLDAATGAQKARLQDGWKTAEQPTASAIVTWPEEMRAQPAAPAPPTPAPK